MCATRSPIENSGYTTWWAPTFSRIWPCLRVIALAQMSATPTSASATTVSTLASMSAPIATTARSKSPTPSWASACSSVLSAWTTWVSSSAQRSTSSASSSTARTSLPICTSDCATAVPNRPSPITTTEAASFVLCFLADNGALLRQVVVVVAGLQRERGGHGDGAHPADVHQHHQRELCGRGQVGGDAGRKAD